MEEHLEIRNFGPIDELVIKDIKSFTIFIGESASGKSTIMKVLAIFRWLYKMTNIRSFLKSYSNLKKSPFRFNFPSYLKQDGLLDYLRDDTFLYYKRGSCEMKYENKKFSIPKGKIPQQELSLEKISYISEKRNIIPDIIDHNVTLNKKEFYLNEVWSDYTEATNVINELDMQFTGVKFIKRRTHSGIKHDIQPVDKDTNYTVKLNDASSGIQSSTPLSLIVEFFSKHYDLVNALNRSVLSYLTSQDMLKDFRGDMNIGDIHNRRVNLFIEEPEISLYPENQIGLVDFLIDKCFISNNKDYDITLMMSTHSPYIVNYLNVLLKRNKKIHIEKDNLAVFRVFEGYIQDLMLNDDTNNAGYVDSRDLSETMETIYNEYVDIENKLQ